MTYSGLVEHVAEERVVGEDGLDAFYSGGNVRPGQREDVDVHDMLSLISYELRVYTVIITCEDRL